MGRRGGPGRRGYPSGHRRRAVVLPAAGRRVADVARELGVGEQAIDGWRRRERIDRGLEPGASPPERAELAAAKRRIRELEAELAVHRRAAEPLKPSVTHRDRGTQYGSWAFTRRAREAGLLPSIGAAGTWFDNALMEPFWSRVQVEPLDRRVWSTRLELATALSENLETSTTVGADTRRSAC